MILPSRNRLLKSFYYLFGSSLAKLIPFLILPIFSKRLSLEEYGTLELFNVLNAMALPILTMSATVNIGRNYSKLNKSELDRLIQSILVILITNLIFLSSILLLVPIEFQFSKGMLFAILLIAFFNGVIQIKTSVLRQKEKVILFNIYELSRVGLGLLFSILLLYNYDSGWRARPQGLTIGLFIVFIAVIFSLKREHLSKIKILKNELRDLYIISFPLIFHGLGTIIINYSDRFLISEMIDKSSVAIYSAAYIISMAILVFTEAFLRIWSPWFYAKQKKNKVFVSIFIYIFILIILTILISKFGGLILTKLVDDKFDSSRGLIPSLSLTFLIYGLYQILQPFLIAYGATRVIAKATILSALINIALNIYLIKRIGIYGAVIATGISFLFNLVYVLSYIIRKKILNKVVEFD